MRKLFLPLSLVPAALLLNACNPVSYFMLYQYSSSEKQDDVADQRITELEQDRMTRMSSSPNYRTEEIDAYRRSRGISSSAGEIDTRPVSTDELRARMEKQAAERRK